MLAKERPTDWRSAMSEPELRIELVNDVLNGPLIKHMSNYSGEQFQALVYNGASDGERRKIIFQNEDLVEIARKAYSGTGAAIEKEVVDIYSNAKLLRRNSNKLSPEPPIEQMRIAEDRETPFEREMNRGIAHLSGPEFLELAKVTIAHSGLVEATVAVALIKATKDIIIEWLRIRAHGKAKISLGPAKVIEITGPIDDEKIEKLLEFLQDGINSTKSKTPSSKS
jgi:hypothetical protein